MRLLCGMLALVFLAGACISSTPVSTSSERPSPSPSPAYMPVTQLCFTSPPGDWSDALSNLIASFDGVNFGPGAVDDHDGLVFGGEWTANGQYFVSLDLATGKTTTIATMPARGFAWMTYADGWLAWPQDGAGGSSIQLYDSATHARREIATSGPAQAVIGHGYVVWDEVAADQTNAIRAFDLSSGKTTSLDSGKLGAPVFAGNYLVWTKFPPGSDQANFVFANATSLQATSGPGELLSFRGITTFSGSADRLVWATTSGAAWYVDDLVVGVIRTYPVRGHHLQYPELAEPYLVWFGADKNTIVDLRTGYGIDLPLPGEVQAAGDTIVVTRGTRFKGRDRTDVAVLHPSQLSQLRGSC